MRDPVALSPSPRPTQHASLLRSRRLDRPVREGRPRPPFALSSSSSVCQEGRLPAVCSAFTLGKDPQCSSETARLTGPVFTLRSQRMSPPPLILLPPPLTMRLNDQSQESVGLRLDTRPLFSMFYI